MAEPRRLTEGADLVFIDTWNPFPWIEGLGGDDLFISVGGQNTLDGGEGADLLLFDFRTHATTGLVISLANGTTATPFGVTTMIGFENFSLIDTQFSDTITGGAGDDSVVLLGGADVVDGGPGHDQVWIDLESERSWGPPGAAGARISLADGGSFLTPVGERVLRNFEQITFFGGIYSNTVTGGADNDQIVGGHGDDQLAGEGGDDSLSGGPSGADTLSGGAGNDTLEDLALGNYLSGGAGNDSLNAGGPSGNNTLHGGAGDDTLVAGGQQTFIASTDRLFGGDGDDLLDSGPGTDFIDGGAGFDRMVFSFAHLQAAVSYAPATDGQITSPIGTKTLSGIEAFRMIGTAYGDVLVGAGFGDQLLGGAGNDDLRGQGGDDSIDGGAGDDLISVHEGADTVRGGAGDDRIDGGSGDDLLEGGAGNDVLFGTDGQDTLLGGDGDDRLDDREGNGVLDGGGGVDTVSLYFALAGQGVAYTFGDSQIATTTGVKTLISIEAVSVIGSAFADTLSGGVFGDILTGGAGDDRLVGGDGDDIFDPGLGADTVVGGAGRDGVNLRIDGNYALLNGRVTTVGGYVELSGVEFATLTGGAANDRLTGGSFNDRLIGGGGADTLTGADGADTIEGQDGADRLFGDGGIDRLDGGAGNDTLTDDTGAGVFIGGTGVDKLVTSFLGAAAGLNLTLSSTMSVTTSQGVGQIESIESFEFRVTPFADTVVGTAASDFLDGAAGNDSLVGGAGGDFLLGRDGSDTLIGGEGNDQLDGGDGDDVLEGGIGDDTLIGYFGAGSYDGGAGFDRLFQSFQGATAGVNFALADQVSIDTSVGVLSLASIEAVLMQGSAFADSLSGGAAIDSLDGGAGSDRLSGFDGNDTLLGGAGDDVVLGGAGSDTAEYSGAGANYQVELLGDGSFQVTDLRNGRPDGVDILHSVEMIRFGPAVRDLLANRTPAARADEITLGEDEALDLWSVLLANDVDSDPGDFLTIVSASGAQGSLTLDAPSRSLVYAADAPGFDALAPGETRVDTFTYMVRDGLGATHSAAVAVTVTGRHNADDAVRLNSPGPHVGEPAGEYLIGTEGADTIDGAAGADRLDGGGAGDVLKGGAGANALYGQAGDDILGGDAVAQVTRFDGGDGLDTLVVTSPGDRTVVDLATAQVSGGHYDGSTVHALENLTAGTSVGAVSFIGDAAGNRLTGGRHEDSLSGGAGADSLSGGSGADTLAGGAQADRLVGGLGNDVFHFRPGEAGGDQIVDFLGNGALAGDTLVFEGFGPGAALTSLGGGRWALSYSKGGVAETEVLTLNTASLHASDYLFT